MIDFSLCLNARTFSRSEASIKKSRMVFNIQIIRLDAELAVEKTYEENPQHTGRQSR